MTTLIAYLVLQASILTGSQTTATQTAKPSQTTTNVIGWDDND